mgnify:CR=1 FL=1
MARFGMFDEVSDATFSPCKVYRYSLTRGFDDGPACNFLMLNPSTATATEDDPTIRRCIGFAKGWGYGVLYVTNLFALRATDPRELYKHAEPVGPDNDRCILTAATGSQLVVAAWGVHGAHRDRGADVARLIRKAGVKLHCLGTTKDGHPRHPLYLPAALTPVAFDKEAA